MSKFIPKSCSLLIALLLVGCSRPPELSSAEAYTTADAIYTAVTSRRSELLDDSEMEIKNLKASGKLSADAFESLNEIIQKGRSGQWETAAQEIDTFIRNQPHHQHSH